MHACKRASHPKFPWRHCSSDSVPDHDIACTVLLHRRNEEGALCSSLSHATPFAFGRVFFVPCWPRQTTAGLWQAANTRTMSASQLADFLIKEQHEAPETVTPSRCVELISRFEPGASDSRTGPSPTLSSYGLTLLLTSEDGDAFNPRHTAVYQDMSQPLAHYFISSSHNTYASCRRRPLRPAAPGSRTPFPLQWITLPPWQHVAQLFRATLLPAIMRITSASASAGILRLVSSCHLQEAGQHDDPFPPLRAPQHMQCVGTSLFPTGLS